MAVTKSPADPLAHRLSVNHPHRPVDWRWRLAVLYAERPGRVRLPVRDRWLVEARKLQTRLAAAGDDSLGRSEALLSSGPLGQAYEIYVLAGQADRNHDSLASLEKDHLDGLILSSAGNARIAASSSLPPEAVEAYEAVFFNVRDRLDSHPGWIAHTVIGKGIHRLGNLKESLGVLIKVHGYQSRTPEVVDALATSASGAAYTGDALGYLSDDGRAAFKRSVAMAARLTQVDPDTSLKVMDAFSKLEANKGVAPPSGGATADALRDMIGSVVWTVGDGRGVDVDEQGNELRVAQQAEQSGLSDRLRVIPVESEGA